MTKAILFRPAKQDVCGNEALTVSTGSSFDFKMTLAPLALGPGSQTLAG
jgi:hypothetical protein